PQRRFLRASAPSARAQRSRPTCVLLAPCFRGGCAALGKKPSILPTSAPSCSATAQHEQYAPAPAAETPAGNGERTSCASSRMRPSNRDSPAPIPSRRTASSPSSQNEAASSATTIQKQRRPQRAIVYGP